MVGRTLVGWLVATLVVTCTCRTQEDEVPVLREKIIVATESTSTVSTLTTMTSVVPYYCFTTNAKECQGRKLRRAFRRDINLEDPGTAPFLQDSRRPSEKENALDALPEVGNQQKYFFTLYKTTTTTLTVVTTSINRDFTVSASAYCTYTGFTGPVCG